MHLFCVVLLKNYKEFTAVKTLIIFILFLLFSSVFAAEITGRVIGVSDGDTITVLDDLDMGKFHIRLDTEFL